MEGLFEGWAEEVDSSIELRFRSTEELLTFLGQRFHVATSSTGKTGSSDCKESRLETKMPRRKKQSS